MKLVVEYKRAIEFDGEYNNAIGEAIDVLTCTPSINTISFNGFSLEDVEEILNLIGERISTGIISFSTKEIIYTKSKKPLFVYFRGKPFN